MIKLFVLPSIMILCGVLHHNLRKKNRSDETVTNYLARESAANGTRRKDISNLPYISVPFDILPLDITLNDEKKQSQIANYKSVIKDLSQKKMLNLIGINNTELKERFGPANLETLTMCDQNYSIYIRTLHLFAEAIYDEYPKDSVKILEYCLSIGTDISKTYELLGRHYLINKQTDLFASLYKKIPDTDSISGKVTLNKLEKLKNSCNTF